MGLKTYVIYVLLIIYEDITTFNEGRELAHTTTHIGPSEV